MNKLEFINELGGHLTDIPQHEATMILNEYAHTIKVREDEGMSEEEAVASLGDIEVLAQDIMVTHSNLPAVKKPRKRRLLTVLLAAVLLVGFAVPAAIGFFGGSRAVSRYYECGLETVDTLTVSCDSADVRIAPTEADTVSVSYFEGGNTSFEFFENDGALTVVEKNSKKLPFFKRLMDFSFNDDYDVVVYVPEGQLGSIDIATASGDLNLRELNCKGGALFYTVSGDMHLSDFSAAEKLDAQSISGEIELNGITADAIDASTTSGEVELYDISTDGDIYISTVSGDVKVTTNAPYRAETSTISGDVKTVAHSDADRVIRVDTTSGDIAILVS